MVNFDTDLDERHIYLYGVVMPELASKDFRNYPQRTSRSELQFDSCETAALGGVFSLRLQKTNNYSRKQLSAIMKLSMPTGGQYELLLRIYTSKFQGSKRGPAANCNAGAKHSAHTYLHGQAIRQRL